MEPRTTVFRVSGLTCADCAMLVREALKNQAGVSAIAEAWTESAVEVTVTHDPLAAPPEKIARAIEAAGSTGSWPHTFRILAWQ
ncbi:MAG: heavy-metal-associated domain-containing protein [Chloroflexi bacterium]|nr:heavy-metal-associated domain-containing protein [Chloroflexota bacterium]